MKIDELFFESDIDEAGKEFMEVINESYIDSFFKESKDDDDDDLDDEEKENFIVKLKNYIEKVVTAIKEFIQKIISDFKEKREMDRLNDVLHEVKSRMAREKAHTDEKITVMDMERYMTYYTDYTKFRAKMLHELFDKEFSSIEEFRAFEDRTNEKLEEFQFNLSNAEKWQLNVSVDRAIKLTEEGIKNREKVAKEIEGEAIEIADAAKIMYEKRLRAKRRKEIALHVFRSITRGTGSFLSGFFSQSMRVSKDAAKEVTSTSTYYKTLSEIKSKIK